MEGRAIYCPNCGASIQGKHEPGFCFCQYCGTRIELDIEYYREDAKTERFKYEVDHRTDAIDKISNLVKSNEFGNIVGAVCLVIMMLAMVAFIRAIS